MKRAGLDERRERPARLMPILLCGLATFAPVVRAAERPVQVALLIDTSGSIRPPDQAIRNALAAEIARTLPAGSEMVVYAFDDRPRLVVPRTTDPATVEKAVAALGAQGQFTALNDAIFDASRALGDGSAGPGPRAIVVITDGLDENSALVLDDGVNAARERGIPIFTVGVGKVEERSLRRVSKLSGGEYFPPGTKAASVVGRITALVLQSPPSPSTPAAAPVASAPPGEAAAGIPSRSALWPILAGLTFAVVLALFTLGFVLTRTGRPAISTGGGAGDSDLDVARDATLVAPMKDLEDDGLQTLVLTPRPLLHVTKGSNLGRFFVVSDLGPTSIGRAKGNDVVLDDLAVSSQHCLIRPAGGVYELVDLKSTNGTFVNERRTARARLAAGDVVKIGETLLQFRMDHTKG